MCLGQFSPDRSTISMDPPSVRDSDSRLRFTAALEAMAAQPSWSLRKVFKPQAPVRQGEARKLAGTAKINLNKYWHVLEDLVHVETSFPMKPRGDSPPEYEDIGMSNEINENLANERYEILAASTSMPAVTMDVDKTPPSHPMQSSQVQTPLLQTPLVQAPLEQTSQVQTPPECMLQLPEVQPSPVQQPVMRPSLVQPSLGHRPQTPFVLRVDERECVSKKAMAPKKLTPRPTRSPLALINGNQRKTLTSAKPLPSSARRSPLAPKSPMTALTENFQRHLYNRI